MVRTFIACTFEVPNMIDYTAVFLSFDEIDAFVADCHREGEPCKVVSQTIMTEDQFKRSQAFEMAYKIEMLALLHYDHDSIASLKTFELEDMLKKDGIF